MSGRLANQAAPVTGLTSGVGQGIRAAGVGAPNGGVETFQLGPPRPLRDDEVLIRVRTAGVGHWDDLMRTGGWPSSLVAPHALGVELAGEVMAIGSKVPRTYEGAEVLGYVFPFRDNGTWAQQVIAPVHLLAHRPASMPWTVAAAIPVPALTAMQAVRAAGDVLGRRVLVHGGGGLTGGLIAQLAVASGADVIVTAGRTSAERLLGVGVRHVVDRTEPAWADHVRELFGGPVDVALNAVPGGAIDVLPLVASGGDLVSIAGPVPAAGRVGVHAVTVEADGELLADAVKAFVGGDLTVPPFRRYPLAAAAAALELARGGAHGAAVVLDIPSSD
jgi:NADPH:quinone reductase-like Zn-dependent oxidoreductase